MTIASSTSAETSLDEAVKSTTAKVLQDLAGSPPHLAFYFASRHHAPGLEDLTADLATRLKAPHILGCTGESIIGGSVEYEDRPAFTLWAASLPGAEVHSGHVSTEQTPDGCVFLGIPVVPPGPSTMILLGEPFSFPVGTFIQRMKEDHPELQVIGGMASAAQSPGENRLFHGRQVCVDGAVAAVIAGNVRVRALVSQGCRPFGKHLVITKSEGNFIRELGGRPALEKLRDQLNELTIAERGLLNRGLHLGLAIDARKRQYRRGDFLVRNVMGIGKDDGAIVVTDAVKPGTTVQFHLRDAETASEDLQILLREARASGAEPRGALLFSCNGRGRRLFDVVSHDASSVARELGGIPVAGFFAAGEIGPVGGQNFLHGFTASLALFEQGPFQ